MDIEFKGSFSMAQLNMITKYLYDNLTNIITNGYSYFAECKFTYKKDKLIIETYN